LEGWRSAVTFRGSLMFLAFCLPSVTGEAILSGTALRRSAKKEDKQAETRGSATNGSPHTLIPRLNHFPWRLHAFRHSSRTSSGSRRGSRCSGSIQPFVLPG